MAMLNPEEEKIFLAARQIESREARSRYVVDACAGDQSLQSRIEALLRIDAESISFMQTAANGKNRGVGGPASIRAGVSIGPYKLVEQIGEGGMGTVFLAEQSEPVQRRVAVKFVKDGVDSRQIIARFQAERQALALMDHPNIAKVFEAGATPAGQPFFVMELVEGQSITRYCDDNHLTPRERLELFIPVCRAIQHAHQKGIIHRDLKPSNIMVAVCDGRPAPKVIDFGVAKAIVGSGPAAQIMDHSLSGEFGRVLGTLEYMSPEQAQAGELDIDTRSDVYSLGVLLYELLTGSKPLDRKRYKEAAVLEWLRIIREEEPPRPSTRLSASDELPSIAANRGVEPKRLTRLFRDDMDWVIMKCLEKDRTRRYDSAAGLARDLERFLNDEPVEASPPSAAYRLRKFVHRNRGAVTAASMMLLLLLAGIVGTTIGLVRTEQARRAEAERAEGERLAKESAEKRLAQIEKGIDVLNAVFENLDPREVEKSDLPLRAILGERLIKAAEQLEGDAVGDPVVVARLQNRLGQSLQNLGLLDQAIRLFNKALNTSKTALGPNHPDTLNGMHNLAVGYRMAGKLDDAVKHHEETLKLRREVLGPDHPDTLTSMNNLGAAYRETRTLNKALPLLQEALAKRQAILGHDHRDTMVSMNNLALAYHVKGQFELAVPLYEKTVELRTAKLGREHHSTLTSMNNLALGLKEINKVDQALPLQEEVYRLRLANSGPDHPDTLVSMGNYAKTLEEIGRAEEALPLLEEALRRTTAKLGRDHFETLATLSNYAQALRTAGKLDQSLPLFEESYTRRKAKFGPDNPRTLVAMIGLGVTLKSVGQFERAIEMLEEALRRQRAILGDEHPDTRRSINVLARTYGEAKKFNLAIALLQESMMIMERRQFKVQDAVGTMNLYFHYLEQDNQFERAEVWRRKLLDVVKKEEGPETVTFAKLQSALADNLVAQKKFAQAEQVSRDSLALWQKIQPKDWNIPLARSVLGEALVGQGKFAEAEPLLLDSYRALKEQETNIPAERKHLLNVALQRIVRLYDAQGKTAEADKWRKMADPEKP